MQHGKTTGILCSRWAKLIKDFYKPKKGTFDTTKVPDLYDNALYDMVHNRHLQLGSLPEVCARRGTPTYPPAPRTYTPSPFHLHPLAPSPPPLRSTARRAR